MRRNRGDKNACARNGGTITANIWEETKLASLKSPSSRNRTWDMRSKWESRTINHADGVSSTCWIVFVISRHNTSWNILFCWVSAKFLDYQDVWHLKVEKRLLRYLVQTRTMCVSYLRSDMDDLVYMHVRTRISLKAKKTAEAWVALCLSWEPYGHM